MSRAATPSEIDAWWQRWPDANLGIVTGRISGVVVVDVDPRHGGEARLAAFEARHGGLPDTVTTATGGGGRHFYFSHPTHLVPSRPLVPGIDLKAESGMVVAPPSRHASGGVYRWLPGHAPDQHELAALPEWLERLSVTLDDSTGAGRPHPISRTATERATFAALWAEVGIDLPPGEAMVLCPFHDDHRPSLHVDAEGCRWFCFGCRRGGGIQALRRALHPETFSKPRPRPDAVEPWKRPTLTPEMQVDVVGESVHQDELLALTGGRRVWSGVHRQVLARLDPVDDNPFDPAAVAVMIEDHLVGHLPRNAARAYRPIIADAITASGEATCLAEIRGGWERSHGDVGLFGVILSLPRPE
jgi:hypothetical protein